MFDKRIWVKLLLTRKKKTHGLLNTSVSQLVQDISNKKTNLLAASNHMLHQTDTCCTKRTSNHRIAPTPSAPFASKILGSSTPYSSTISCLFHPRHFVWQSRSLRTTCLKPIRCTYDSTLISISPYLLFYVPWLIGCDTTSFPAAHRKTSAKLLVSVRQMGQRSKRSAQSLQQQTCLQGIKRICLAIAASSQHGSSKEA